MGYNIPMVDSYVVDQSTLITQQTSGRTVLIPYFSKFGDEALAYIYKSDSSEIPQLGAENARLYGNSVKFIKNVLSINNTRVLGYRLLPSDATFANKLYESADDNTISSSTKESIIDLNTILDGTKSQIVFGAKNRGKGYNDVFVSCVPDTELSLTFASDEGVEYFRNNFYNATVYENTPNGNVVLESGIKFSLMETDLNGVPFKNPQNGQNLFIVDAFNKFSKFVSVKLTDTMIDDLMEFPTVEQSDNSFPLINDVTTGASFKVEVDEDKKIKLIRIENGNYPTEVIYKNASDNLFRIKIDERKFIVESIDTSDESYTQLLFDGVDGIYEIKIEDDATYTTTTRFNTVRSNLGVAITETKITLQSGFDGINLSARNRFNLDGAGDIGKENGKMLLIDFYKGNQEIHNTVFPKFSFDYVPDHSNDDDVKSAISNLTSTIRLAMGIVSSNFALDYTDDVAWREDVFYDSNMHIAIYSGQVNTSHFDESTGSDIPMGTVLYALLKHLIIDTTMSITEPVANTVKGQLPVAGATLSYKPQPAHIEELIRKGINCVVDESDGKYFITQMTSYKKASKLARINNVKTIHVIRKALPPLLKDLLQNKALGSIINEARRRVDKYMEQWAVRDDNPIHGIFTSIESKPFFDETTNILYIYLHVTFVGIIEKISIPIIVK